MIELWVNNINIPVEGGDRIVLKKSNAQIAKLDTRQGTFTNDFDVPMTAEVIEALGFADKQETTGSFPYSKQYATLQIGGVVIDVGHVRLTDVNYLSEKFRLNFTSGNTNWISALGDFSIQDIDTTDLEHTWDNTTIVATFTGVYDGYIYPILNYGGIDTTYASTWDPAASGGGWEPDHLFPALFQKTIITRGLNYHGIKVGGPFTDSWEWHHTILPFCANEFFNTTGDEAVLNDTVNPGQNNLPDIKLLDFIKDMIIRHALIPIFDPYTNTLNLYTYEYVINRTFAAIDWSDKVDPLLTTSASFTEMLQEYGRTSYFRYKEPHDDDFKMAGYNSWPYANMGEGEINISNEHLPENKTVYTSIFSPSVTYPVQYSSVPLYLFFQMFIPFIDLDTGERTLKHNPRICYVILDCDVDDVSYLDPGGNVRIRPSTFAGTIPWAFFAKTRVFTDIDNVKHSLSFGESPYTISSTPLPPSGEQNPGETPLLTKNYSGISRILNSPRYIKSQLRLRAHEFLNIDFTTPVYIDSNNIRGYFIIDIVEYDGDIAEVGLIQIV